MNYLSLYFIELRKQITKHKYANNHKFIDALQKKKNDTCECNLLRRENNFAMIV